MGWSEMDKLGWTEFFMFVIVFFSIWIIILIISKIKDSPYLIVVIIVLFMCIYFTY